MKQTLPKPADTLETIPRMPGWVSATRPETSHDDAFLSGAALATLHMMLARSEIPQALLRDRLALRAAEACVVFAGRSERAGDLRDEIHLLRAGDNAGPAGTLYQTWQRAVSQKVSLKSLHRALRAQNPQQIAVWMGAEQGNPVDRAAHVLEAAIRDVPEAEEVALILADATLAQMMGWGRLVPLFAISLNGRDLRMTGKDLRRACHRSVVASAVTVVQTGGDLARRVARLQAVRPKLRSKAASQAVDAFVTRDALAPSVALTDFMSGRSARRLCDRLVELGVVRELTGRDSFRLYGV